MSWFKKFAVMMLVVSFSACGFKPVYYTSEGGKAYDELTAAIALDPVPEENGRIFTQRLRENLNPENISVPKKYRLSVQIVRTENQDQGIQDDNTASRATTRMRATYVLRKTDTGDVLSKRSLTAVSSYNILRSNPYATVTSSQNTDKLLLQDLADQMALHLTEALKEENEN